MRCIQVLPLIPIIFITFSNWVIGKESPIIYTINITGPSYDTFAISCDVQELKVENNVYQFAATAPGTYQVMDIGRFVSNFRAFDKKGREVGSKRISTNQWQISNPEKVKKITYKIAETWDSPVKENNIYRMAGSSLEIDHALLNMHCLVGFFKNLQEADLKFKLEYPQGWDVGTPMKKDQDGYYEAPDYDYSVDSPILLGRLSKSSLDLEGRLVEIYTYSKTDKIKSEDLLQNMETMLKAANAFLVKLPVDRYVFLFHFEDQTYGAWEHSYSSEYIFKEMPITSTLANHITSIAAHEFFHVVTPLNIHSEIIENFNFSTPTASEHLWLYEGTTEWASDIMQLRYGIQSLEEYLAELQKKLIIDSKHDKNLSLSKMSLISYTEEGQKQYFNIYNRGAVVAALLDIRLLELSKGKRGYRELILDLAKEYGPNKAFPEKELFNILISKTYPEIGDFFKRYVQSAEQLPVQEYFAKLGIEYLKEEKALDSLRPSGLEVTLESQKILVKRVNERLKALGVHVGDEITAFNEAPIISVENLNQKLKNLKVNEPFSISLNQEGQQKVLKTKVYSADEDKHLFKPMQNASQEQKNLREKWLQNLPY